MRELGLTLHTKPRKRVGSPTHVRPVPCPNGQTTLVRGACSGRAPHRNGPQLYGDLTMRALALSGIFVFITCVMPAVAGAQNATDQTLLLKTVPVMDQPNEIGGEVY